MTIHPVLKNVIWQSRTGNRHAGSFFDDAAMSFPKPCEVMDVLTDYITGTVVSPCRSGQSKSLDAGKIVPGPKEVVAALAEISMNR